MSSERIPGPNARRALLKTAAALPLLPAALVAAAPAASPAPAPASPAPLPAGGPGPLARAYAGILGQRFGSQLGPGDVDELARMVQEGLDDGERLRDLKLGNADEPVTVFRVTPAGGGR